MIVCARRAWVFGKKSNYPDALSAFAYAAAYAYGLFNLLTSISKNQ
jgi:hypothetical protein